MEEREAEGSAMSSVMSRMSVEHNLSAATSRTASQLDSNYDGTSDVDDRDSPMVTDRSEPELQRVFKKEKETTHPPKETKKAHKGSKEPKKTHEDVPAEKEDVEEQREDWEKEKETWNHMDNKDQDKIQDENEQENKGSEIDEAPPTPPENDRSDSVNKSKARSQRTR